MSDPYHMTAAQRVYFFAVVAVYFVLELVPGISHAAALQDLVTVALAAPIGAVVVHRTGTAPETDRLVFASGIALLVAAAAYGYMGIAALVDLPAVPLLTVIGPVALLAGLLVYVYRAVL